MALHWLALGFWSCCAYGALVLGWLGFEFWAGVLVGLAFLPGVALGWLAGELWLARRSIRRFRFPLGGRQ